MTQKDTYVFCADVGTTSLKACIFSSAGEMKKSVSVPYELITTDNRVEFEAEDYFTLLMKAYRELSAEYTVSAISIDTQGETMILCDSDGKPLRRAIVWLDDRAKSQAERIEKHFGARRVYEVTGQPEISAVLPAGKLLWIRENEPEIFRKTYKILLLEDWLMFRLTGNYVTERSLQSSTLYLDIRNGGWFSDMLDFVGISENQLPELHESGEKIGEFEGVPVFTGALDQIAGMIGAGSVRPGIVSEMTGTTMAVSLVTYTIPEWHEGLKVPCHYISKGKYCLLMWSPTAGIALEWFRNNFCGNTSFRELDEQVEKVPAGCEGLVMLPYLCGSTMPVYNPDIRGVFYGVELKHTGAHFARSIMEAVACMLREYLEYLEADVSEIRSIGGGANSRVWLQMKSDITGKKIRTLECRDVACLGCAILALSGMDESIDVETAAQSLVTFDREFNPCEDQSFVYENYHSTDLILNCPIKGDKQNNETHC